MALTVETTCFGIRFIAISRNLLEIKYFNIQSIPFIADTVVTSS